MDEAGTDNSGEEGSFEMDAHSFFCLVFFVVCVGCLDAGWIALLFLLCFWFSSFLICDL